MHKYEKNYIQIIRRIVKNRKVPWDQVVIVKDCPRDEIWRHDIYSEYKSTRKENNKHFTGGLVFKYTHSDIFPYLQNTYKCHILRIKRAEADDIISILHSYYRKKNHSDKIYILSVDSDYVQLLDSNTYIINIYNNEIRKVQNVQEYVLYKILNGDKSDNIKKCFSRHVSKQLCIDFIMNPEKLTNELNKSKKSKAKYELNKKLILFSNIPKDIVDAVILWASEVLPNSLNSPDSPD